MDHILSEYQNGQDSWITNIDKNTRSYGVGLIAAIVRRELTLDEEETGWAKRWQHLLVFGTALYP
jgi:hypothetical protein